MSGRARCRSAHLTVFGVALLLLLLLLHRTADAVDALRPGTGRLFQIQPGSALTLTVVDLIPGRSYEARVSHSAMYPAAFRVEVVRASSRRLLDVDKTMFMAGPEGVADVKVTAEFHGVAPNPDLARQPIPFDLIVMELQFGLIPADTVALIVFLVALVAIALLVIVPGIHRAYFSDPIKQQHYQR